MTAKVILLGIAIDNITFNKAIHEIIALARTDGNHFVVTPNVDHLMKLQHDSEFRSLYAQASLVLPDGQPLIWAARFLGTPFKAKISGSDLFPKLCEASAGNDLRVFFLGGRPRAADICAHKLKTRFPALRVVGTYCPDFGFEKSPSENAKIIDLISAAAPHILFVALGAPKQEKWIFRHKTHYQVPVSIGVGASLDFYSGLVKRAPVWMQKWGLEWLWRVASEPKRLWRRYLLEDMQFFNLVYHQYRNRRFRQP
jgi:N-acetylglucosaminyldiphosphoundecaprenol N-acetyl-beta-D-mannosaminyltransferase